MQVESPISKHEFDSIEPVLIQPSRKLAVFALAGLSAVFLISVLFKPATGNYFTVCGFKNLTGLPCPGCGLTHSFCALGSGDVYDAFAFNLLGPPLFLVLLLVWVRSACVLLNKSSAVYFFGRMAGRVNLVRTFAIAFGVYGVARIAYVLFNNPNVFDESPLSKLIARLIH